MDRLPLNWGSWLRSYIVLLCCPFEVSIYLELSFCCPDVVLSCCIVLLSCFLFKAPPKSLCMDLCQHMSVPFPPETNYICFFNPVSSIKCQQASDNFKFQLFLSQKATKPTVSYLSVSFLISTFCFKCQQSFGLLCILDLPLRQLRHFWNANLICKLENRFWNGLIWYAKFKIGIIV